MRRPILLLVALATLLAAGACRSPAKEECGRHCAVEAGAWQRATGDVALASTNATSLEALLKAPPPAEPAERARTLAEICGQMRDELTFAAGVLFGLANDTPGGGAERHAAYGTASKAIEAALVTADGCAPAALPAFARAAHDLARALPALDFVACETQCGAPR